MTDAMASKDCSFCAEPIKVAAKKCRHCGETLDVALRAAEEAMRFSGKNNNQNVNVNTIVGVDNGRLQGSWIILIFWILVFFPFAIVYFLMRRWC